MMKSSLIVLNLLSYSSYGRSISNDHVYDPVPLNNLSSPYTLTAFHPGNSSLNGLKVNNLNLFQAAVYQYCPFIGNQSNLCPNGTDMAFASSLYPVSRKFFDYLRLCLGYLMCDSLLRFQEAKISMYQPTAR